MICAITVARWRKPCPNCYAAKRQAERDAESIAAAEANAAASLPTLEGGDEQIARAETIRRKAIEYTENMVARLDVEPEERDADLPSALLAQYLPYLRRQTSVAWWMLMEDRPLVSDTWLTRQDPKHIQGYLRDALEADDADGWQVCYLRWVDRKYPNRLWAWQNQASEVCTKFIFGSKVPEKIARYREARNNGKDYAAKLGSTNVR